MKPNMITLWVLLSFFTFDHNTIAFSQAPGVKGQKPNLVTNQDIQRLDQAISNLQGAQLNLLKDTYSTAYTTINIVITIALGLITFVIAILGFYGIKSINKIKTKFKEELKAIKILIENFEDKFLEIANQQEKAKEEIDTILKANQKYDSRIRILELQEKVSTLIKIENFRDAIKYLEMGLETEPKNETLLRQKVVCCSNISDYSEAIKCNEIIVNICDCEMRDIANLAELYLLNGNLKRFDSLKNKNWVSIVEYKSPFLLWYFELLKIYADKDLAKVKIHIDKKIRMLKELKNIEPSIWSFRELKNRLKVEEDSELKTILQNFVLFFEGETPVSKLNDAVASK